MGKDLTNSLIDRKNILNNQYALKKIEEDLSLGGYYWNEDYWFTKNDAANLFGVDIRTIENYLSNNEDELKASGYMVLKGKTLKDFKSSLATENNFGPKVTNLAILSFRAVLNLAMLLTESEKAKQIRSRILDIVIDVMTEKTGGQTKYINQKDPEYLIGAYRENDERKKFTDALNKYIDMGSYKYGYFTNKIYECIFKENAKEYRKILQLEKKDKTRDTMYTEILTSIASFEAGLAYEFESYSNTLGRQLTKDEADKVLAKFANHPMHKPYLDDARSKMASRDLCFRDALHYKLENYISSVDKKDFEKFLGEASKSLEKQIEEYEDVFKRLRDK